jgi:hypothetical protein
MMFKMNKATMNDLNEVWSIFAPYLKSYFPHIRRSHIEHEIKRGNVIFDNDVVIVYNQYKRKQQIGTKIAQKNDVVIKQIVSKTQGSGTAFEVSQRFIKSVNANIWLKVRSDNLRARSFYEKLDMKKVEDISWAEGKIPGVIYFLENKS